MQRDGEDEQPPPVMMQGPPHYLAKLYRLGENESEWVDCGVVRVRCGFLETRKETCLILTAESDPRKVVLETPISRSEYRRDVATIISWADTLENFHPVVDSNGDNSAALPVADGAVYELALSFETPEGSSHIYDDICKVLGRVASDYRIDGHPQDDDGHGGLHLDIGSHSPDDVIVAQASSISAILPPLSRSALPRIVNKLKTSSSALFRSRLAAEIVAHETARDIPGDALSISGVLNMYDEVEKSEEDAEKRKKDLHQLFELVRCIALLDDDKIFEILLTDAYFERVAGCLENDPSVRVPPAHRRFLREEAKFNQVVPITKVEVQNMIIQRFRLGFLRDVLLPRVLDENSFKRLSTMDISLSADIARNLQDDQVFMGKLFDLLNEPASEHRVKGIAFLSELCGLSQKMAPLDRSAFYQTVNVDDRLLKVCERILADGRSTSRERLDVGEILLLVLKHDVNIARARIIATERVVSVDSSSSAKTTPNGEENIAREECSEGPPSVASSVSSSSSSATLSPQRLNGTHSPKRSEIPNRDEKSLLALLSERLVNDEDAGVQAQARQLLEILLDSESFVSQQKEDDPIIGMFYESHFLSLVDALEMLAPERRRKFSDPDVPLNAAHLVSELLCFCVRMHGYVVREVIAKESVVQKVLRLLDCREKHMVLDAIRFVRTCIGMKESFYNEYFINHDLFAPVVRAFVKNGPKNNLLNSTVIDLLEFIKLENAKSLVEYVVTHFQEDLRPIGAYVNTFKDLEELHQKNLAFASSVGAASIVKSPSTQSLHSNSSMSDPSSGNRGRVPTSTLLGGVRHHRVSARSNNIFGEPRPMREDDDEAFFDDDVPTSPNENSPSKRARMESAPTERLVSDF